MLLLVITVNISLYGRWRCRVLLLASAQCLPMGIMKITECSLEIVCIMDFFFSSPLMAKWYKSPDQLRAAFLFCYRSTQQLEAIKLDQWLWWQFIKLLDRLGSIAFVMISRGIEQKYNDKMIHGIYIKKRWKLFSWRMLYPSTVVYHSRQYCIWEFKGVWKVGKCAKGLPFCLICLHAFHIQGTL